MRRVSGAAALAVLLVVASARAQSVPGPAEGAGTPAANLAVVQPCGPRAARYAGAKGFALSVTRIGRASVENPLRPLTPEVTQVLQVVIGAKLATAYGPDLAALRRGPAPGALEAQLGAPIRWEAALPDLPDPLAIVAEDGTPLATLAFRDCTDAPAVKPPPAPARAGKGETKGDDRGAPRRAPKATAAPKAPPGFQMPQGAIAE